MKFVLLLLISSVLGHGQIPLSLSDTAFLSKGNWYSAAWSKRQTITITGSSAGAQTNYQVQIAVPYNASMQADFDDVRFTRGTTLLDHWLESKTNSVNALFWVEVPLIPASPGTVEILMYYGNPSAASSSSGPNTFIAGTDFAQDDGYFYSDNGVLETYGNASGQVRSSGGILSLVSAARDADSYVSNNKKSFIIGSVVSSTSLNEPEDVLVDGDYAYIPCREGAMLSVYSVATPTNPLFVSSFTNVDLTEAMGVVKNGTNIYLTSWHNRMLLILDATNPTNLVKTSSIALGTTNGTDQLRKVFYQSNYCYVTHSAEGKLYIVDVSSSASPSITGSVSTGNGAFAIFVKGNYAYVGGCFVGTSLNVIDVSNKAAPVLVKTLSSANYSCAAGFENSGDYLFCIYYSTNNLVTFNISDPPNTSQVGILNSAEFNFPNRMDLSGNIVWVVSSVGDAVVRVDVTNPTNAAVIYKTTSSLLDQAYGIQYAGTNLFVVGRIADSLVVLEPFTRPALSVSNNFSVRSKLRFTAAAASAWLPSTGISADGSPVNNNANSYSLNPVWQTGTLQLIEFFGIGGTYYNQSTNTVATSLSTIYITEMKKVGSNATLSVYQAIGSLVGSAVIPSLTNPNIEYKWFMPFHNVDDAWSAGVSTHDIYFSFLRRYISPEPTVVIGP